MTRTSVLLVIALVAGIVLVAVAVMYAAEPASSLPSVLPGHGGATSGEHAHHHLEHAIAALALALAAFAYAWFQTGPAARDVASLPVSR